jgi:hypothetical protein
LPDVKLSNSHSGLKTAVHVPRSPAKAVRFCNSLFASGRILCWARQSRRALVDGRSKFQGDSQALVTPDHAEGHESWPMMAVEIGLSAKKPLRLEILPVTCSSPPALSALTAAQWRKFQVVTAYIT